MRFQPRHYLLLAVIVALGAWNLLRAHRSHPGTAPTAAAGPATPGWAAFDQAAALRDAPETQFAPALAALRQQASTDTGADAPDLRNCMMWLQYYRHSVPTAGGGGKNWGMLATSHVQTCGAEHRDLGR